MLTARQDLGTAPRSTQLSMMLGWRLSALLTEAPALRALRATCSELRAVVNELIDTLTLPLDAATLQQPATLKAIAAFHRQCRAATRLRVCIAYEPPSKHDAQAACRAAAAYAAALMGSGLPCGHCCISVENSCELPPALLQSLLLALPRLSELSLALDDPESDSAATPEAAAAVLACLVPCTTLRTLRLDCNGLRCSVSSSSGWSEVVARLGQLTQLRALYLNVALAGKDMSALASLPHLETLGLEGLRHKSSDTAGVSVALPNVRTLFGTVPVGSPLADWHPYLPTGVVQLRMLGLLPGLRCIERLHVLVFDEESPEALQAALQKAARRDGQWVLIITPEHPSLASFERWLSADLAPRLHGVYTFSLLREIGPRLKRLVAAACNLRGICVWHPTISMLAADMTALRPLKRAARLESLWIRLSMPDEDDDDDRAACAANLVSIVQYLLEPEGQDGACCGALECVVVVGESKLAAACADADTVLMMLGCRVEVSQQEWLYDE